MMKTAVENSKNWLLQARQGSKAAFLKNYGDTLLGAQAAFLDEEPPSRRDEDWKYDDLQFLSKNTYELLKTSAPNRVEVLSKKIHLSINNTGPDCRIEGAELLPAGLRLLNDMDFNDVASKLSVEQSLNNSWSYRNYFSSLDYALVSHQLFLVVGREFNGDIPVEIQLGLDLKADAALGFANIHLIVLVEKGARASLIEKTFLSKNRFLNAGVDYFLQDSAELKVLKIEQGEAEGRGVHTARYSLGRDARLFATTANLGGHWSRHNVYAEMTAEGAEAQLLAAYVAHGKQFIDHHTRIDHKAPHTTSLQHYTGVLSESAKAVFNGQVHIYRYAQKSSAEQMNRNLLLSKTAEVNTKPELRIDADDVKAKHGATVGQINPEEIFYLVSRGIPESQARQMLTRGFIGEIGLAQPEQLRGEFFTALGEFLKSMPEV